MTIAIEYIPSPNSTNVSKFLPVRPNQNTTQRKEEKTALCIDEFRAVGKNCLGSAPGRENSLHNTAQNKLHLFCDTQWGQPPSGEFMYELSFDSKFTYVNHWKPLGGGKLLHHRNFLNKKASGCEEKNEKVAAKGAAIINKIRHFMATCTGKRRPLKGCYIFLQFFGDFTGF